MRLSHALITLFLVAVLLGHCSESKAAQPPTIEPWLGDTHISDIFTGKPLFAQPPGCEQTSDWLGAGLTIGWHKFEFDIAHGLKARDFWCGAPYREKSQSGTMLSFRWYPLRKR